MAGKSKGKAMEGELIDAPDKKLVACGNRIHAVNNRFGQQFVQWIATVGKELRAGQKLLARHRGGLGKWCKAEFGWTRQHVFQLMSAAETTQSLIKSTMVDVVPENERQCRELTCVPKSELPKVWNEIVKKAKEEGTPITAKLIRDFTEEYRVTDDEEVDEGVIDEGVIDEGVIDEGVIDEEEVGVEEVEDEETDFGDEDDRSAKCDMITRWLRKELNQWPEEYRGEVCLEIEQLIHAEYKP